MGLTVVRPCRSRSISPKRKGNHAELQRVALPSGGLPAVRPGREMWRKEHGNQGEGGPQHRAHPRRPHHRFRQATVSAFSASVGQADVRRCLFLRNIAGSLCNWSDEETHYMIMFDRFLYSHLVSLTYQYEHILCFLTTTASIGDIPARLKPIPMPSPLGSR